MTTYIKLIILILLIIPFGLLSSCKPKQESLHDQAMIYINNADLNGLEKLIKSDSSLTKTVDNYDKRTLLHNVFSKSYFDNKIKLMADLLIAAGSDVDAIDDRGMTPAHCAVYYGHSGEEALNYLIGKGANIELKDRDGNTPKDYLDSKK
jgi:ankyrin repeat protein